MVEVTKREILVSVIIVCLLLCLGLTIDSKIVDIQISSKEKYSKALKINENDEMFRYAIETSVGNIINYGQFSVDMGITDKWLKKDYMSIEKITEEYSRHYRTECSGSGKSRRCHTVTYYTWDEIDSQTTNVTKIQYSGLEFNFSDFSNFPKYKLKLDTDSVAEDKINKVKDNYIYDEIRFFHSVGDKRYSYMIVDKTFKGTVFGIAKNKKLKDGASLKITTQGITEFVDNKNNNFNIARFIFWLFYITICVGIVAYYVYLENDYLED